MKSLLAFLTAPVLALSVTAAVAQTAAQPEDHELHHPAGEAAPIQAAPGTNPSAAAPPAASPPQAMMSCCSGMMGAGGGMMGQGQSSMCQGMMAQGGGMTAGMMGGDMGQMMQRMMAMRQAGMAPGAARAFDRIEGQLAYFRTELGVTEAQTPQWNAFAEVVRAQTGKLREAHMQGMASAAQPASAPAQLERRAELLRAQLDATEAVAAAVSTLYATLGDEQKRTADALMAEHLQDMRMLGL